MYKVLIIDDEKDICFLISEILKDEKYTTYSAQNSNEAIDGFYKNNPDLVILDVWLSNSKLDGIEILKEFKKIKNYINENTVIISINKFDEKIESFENIFLPVITSSSVKLGVTVSAIGNNNFFIASIASSETSLSPDVATITGSRTILIFSEEIEETIVSTIFVSGIIPVLTQLKPISFLIDSIWEWTISSGIIWISSTPFVFWAVTDVTTDTP